MKIGTIQHINTPYQGTEALLTELFSQEEAMEFRRNVTSFGGFAGGRTDYVRELSDYKEHILSCIVQLKVYGERVQNFWKTEPELTKRSTILPFLSMSFDETDRQINEYISEILRALKIEFETGEHYSKESIPDKVKNRIANSGLFIVVFVKRNRLEDSSYTTSAWLIKEMGIAQGCKKEIIAWVEQGINEKEIANLNYEKEIIYFDRMNVEQWKKQLLSFLKP